MVFLFNQSCKTSSQHPRKEIDTTQYLFKDLPRSLDNVSIGVLTDLKFLKFKNQLYINYDINLNDIKYLTISYLKPSKECWYDNQKNINSNLSNSYRNKIRKKLNSEILFLHADRGQKLGESKWDISKYIYKLFPEGFGNGFCDFTVTVSHTGYYFFKVSHFYSDIANAFKNELENVDMKNNNENKQVD